MARLDVARRKAVRGRAAPAGAAAALSRVWAGRFAPPGRSLSAAPSSEVALMPVAQQGAGVSPVSAVSPRPPSLFSPLERPGFDLDPRFHAAKEGFGFFNSPANSPPDSPVLQRDPVSTINVLRQKLARKVRPGFGAFGPKMLNPWRMRG